MPKNSDEHAEEGLTIVNFSLIRVSSDEWNTPEHVFSRIQGAALSTLIAVCKRSKTEADLRILLLLDCFLRVSDERPLTSPLVFGTPRFRAIQRRFYGALGSSRFIRISDSTRDGWVGSFFRVMSRLSNSVTVASPVFRYRVGTAIPSEFIDEFENLSLNANEIRELRPYLLTSATGVKYNVQLAPLAKTVGVQFADAFHNGLQEIARARAKSTSLRDFGTTFSHFIQQKFDAGEQLEEKDLQDKTVVQTLIVDFMEFHFMKMTRRQTAVQETTLSSLQKLWSRYQTYWEQLANKGIVAAPLAAFPEGNPQLLNTSSVGHRRIVVEEDGSSSLITQKLIAPVPLHVTDDEATKILFQQLECDFEKVRKWLSQHLDEFFVARERVQQLMGNSGPLPSEFELQEQLFALRKEAEGVHLAVRYFITKHMGYIDTLTHETLAYPDKAARNGPPKSKVASYLGLPSRRDALALMGYLATQDGRFTEAGMSDCILLDRHGKRINAVETDGGLTLSVLKARDAHDGWHDITLKGEAAQYVRRWIDATEPIRAYMQAHDIEGWRNLFIFLTSPLGSPSHFTRSTNLFNSFRQFSQANEPKLGVLAEQITIARIRSTKGVLVFLEKMDIGAMARELGNATETTLRHYLPDSLWHYFATRWLRIFQNLMIVEATKGTPYMQRALKFHSAAEMDEFLRNHAVKSILPDDDEDDTPSVGRNLSELMVPASTGLFATLLSVAEATDQAVNAGREIAPQAVYWTKFAKLIQAHVLSEDFHDRSIKSMMAEASKNISPNNFAEVVCA